VDIRAQDLRAARAQILPDFNLFAGYGYSAQDLVDGSADFAVGANLTFNILDLGRTPRIRQAHSGWQAAKLQLQQKANEISLEVVQAHSRYRAAREQLKVAASAVLQAAEALRIVQDRHGEGLSTIAEVLNAQTALLRARMNLLGSRYQYYLGFARARLTSGSLEDLHPFNS
jgi:outer membrane protein TolC